MYDLYIKGWSCSKLAKTFGLEYDNHVQKILMRKLNIGIMQYKGQEYKGIHEPLVPEDVYYAAMAKMRERSSVRVTQRGANLLAGLIYCKKCGSRMRYMKNGPTKHRLYCYSRMKDKPYMHKADSCDMVTIDATQIEEIVLNDLFQISFNLQADTTIFDNITTNPLDELELQINRTQERIKKLYALYVEDNDELLYDSIQEQKTKLALLQQEYAIEQENHMILNRVDAARKTVSTLAEAWDYMSDIEKQQAVRDCVEKILISENQVEIYYTFVKNNLKGKA
jgi:site-specific DNA recombinase